jgi:lactoylglutathione lyase
MRHSCGVVLNLLGPANVNDGKNILMDVKDKHPGITHLALTVTSLEKAKAFMKKHNIQLTGSFSFKGMSAIFIRDPDRNVIELDAYEKNKNNDTDSYSDHP